MNTRDLKYLGKKSVPKLPSYIGHSEVGTSMWNLAQSLNSAHSARAVAGNFEAFNAYNDALERQNQTNSANLIEAASASSRRIQEMEDLARLQRDEQLVLLRKAADAAEQASADALRHEQEARARERRSYAIAVVGAVVGVAGVLLAAWPFILTRIDAL